MSEKTDGQQDLDGARNPLQERRHLDVESLKALAHPLRVQMFDHLTVHGPNTASGLGEALGESSGSTSYHLRQLARHGFVREAEGRGSARERWWEVVPGGFAVQPDSVSEPAERQAHHTMLAESLRLREGRLREFIANQDRFEPEWRNKGLISLVNVQLTAAELEEFVRRQELLIAEFVEGRERSARPGSRPVQIQSNVFPVFGGTVEPGEGK